MTDPSPLRERLDTLVNQCLTPGSAPGIALALTDRDRPLLTASYGSANLDANQPVTDETLFEIGSIGKSFTAIALLQLREEGTVDFHAPVVRYLPWFEVRTAYEPITIHHLLSHTAGIIGGTDFTPAPTYEVWSLRETETGCPPGERFSYSNLGYKLLGLVLEEIEGKPYREVIQTRIFDPLGMTNSASVITHALRPRLAVGYTSLYDDRSSSPDERLVPATWLETDTGDGCLATNAEDLATYLRMILNRGQGPSGRVLTEESFALLTTPVIEAWDGAHYAYGLGVGEKDGTRWVGHGGGMVGYSSEMLGDPELGVGMVVLLNGRFAHGDVIERYALALLRAWRRGEPLPEVPALPDPRRIEGAEQFAGVYQQAGRRVVVAADDDRLTLKIDGLAAPLTRIEGDDFRVDHPAFPLGSVRFGRDGERVIELTSGGDWYHGEQYDGPTSFDYPEEWNAYAGHYRSHNPWSTNFRVVLRKGRLHAFDKPLEPLGDGLFRVGGDPRAPERIQFDTIVNGKAQRALVDRGPYYRFFTP
ncbi:MAG: beta-lactamase family protein [Chloroflexota bacterium]|nr:beta-lactamase family protein [Chloroflexota bacterium]